MQRYKIQPNDNLYEIAKRYRVSFLQLLEVNQQITNPAMIYVGEKIYIPQIAELLEENTIELPNQVEIINTNAEDIIDDINNKEWEKAKNKVIEITDRFIELNPILEDNMVANDLIDNMANEITDLENAVDSKNSKEAKVHANLITGHITDILDYFTNKYPSDVNRLAFLYRAIMVDAENNDWDSANSNIEKANTIWNELKLKLYNTYSKDVNNFNQDIISLQQSIVLKDTAQTITNSNKLLSKIDNLKKDFNEQIAK